MPNGGAQVRTCSELHRGQQHSTPYDLGYRAHVIHHKVYMLTTGTPHNIERKKYPEQFSGLLATYPLWASADDGAL